MVYEDFIENYRVRYELIKKQKKIAGERDPVSFEQNKLQPNTMQVAFVKNVKELIKKQEQKALLISATGTGKTYASAFALREMNPKKILFLVHREQIAKQALVSYKRVFGSKRTDGSIYKYSLLSGNTSKDIENI